ncbi:MAG: hypothetical protein QF442_00025 [Candidatus Peribacteraceae bacterium]|jgi:hypothetical protein|nr:hypothetical protein [Candidatus Peribacteraceae bacterium]
MLRNASENDVQHTTPTSAEGEVANVPNGHDELVPDRSITIGNAQSETIVVTSGLLEKNQLKK